MYSDPKIQIYTSFRVDISTSVSYFVDMVVNNRQKENFSPREQHIADMGKMLSHPARIRVIDLLLEHTSMTSSEIASEIPLARTTVLQHIAALKDGNWVKTSSDGSTIRYSINSDAFRSVTNELETLSRNCNKSTDKEEDPIKILFLCTGNSCRSQMAEGFINAYSDRYNVKAFSAGTRPAKFVQPLAIQVMAEKHIDISSHYPKEAKQFAGDKSIDLVIIVCDQAEKECPYLFPLSKHKIFMPFKDPETITEFREVRDLIELKLKNLLAELPEK